MRFTKLKPAGETLNGNERDHRDRTRTPRTAPQPCGRERPQSPDSITKTQSELAIFRQATGEIIPGRDSTLQKQTKSSKAQRCCSTSTSENLSAICYLLFVIRTRGSGEWPPLGTSIANLTYNERSLRRGSGGSVGREACPEVWGEHRRSFGGRKPTEPFLSSLPAPPVADLVATSPHRPGVEAGTECHDSSNFRLGCRVSRPGKRATLSPFTFHFSPLTSHYASFAPLKTW